MKDGKLSDVLVKVQENCFFLLLNVIMDKSSRAITSDLYQPERPEGSQLCSADAFWAQLPWL